MIGLNRQVLIKLFRKNMYISIEHHKRIENYVNNLLLLLEKI